MSENEQDKQLEEDAGEETAKAEKSGREAYEWVQALVCVVVYGGRLPREAAFFTRACNPK